MDDFLVLADWGNSLAVVAIVPSCMLIGGIMGFGRSTLVTLSGLLAFYTGVCGLSVVQELVVPNVEALGVDAPGVWAALPATSFVAIVAFVWLVLGRVSVAKVGQVMRKFDGMIDRLGGGVIGGCGGVLLAASLQCAVLLTMASLERQMPAEGQVVAASLVLKSYSNFMMTDYRQTLNRFLATESAVRNEGDEISENAVGQLLSEEPAVAR